MLRYALAGTLLLTPISASADEVRVTRSYGEQTLAADTVALTIVGVSLGVASVKGMFVGGAVYSIGAPVIHFAHGNVGSGFASLGLRALPGLIILGNCTNDACIGTTFLVAGVVAAGVIALDAIFLAKEEVVEKRAVSPIVSISPTLAFFGVSAAL
jgi:hypothetical protein